MGLLLLISFLFETVEWVFSRSRPFNITDKLLCIKFFLYKTVNILNKMLPAIHLNAVGCVGVCLHIFYTSFLSAETF